MAEVLANKSIKSTDVFDDSFFESLIENTSRLIDEQTARFFYPRLQTRKHDLPMPYNPMLRLSADCVTINSVVNGDTTTVASSNYFTYPYEDTPIWAIELKNSSQIIWMPDVNMNNQAAISINGIWAYHTDAFHMWRPLTTLAAAIATTSVTTFTATNGALFSSGQIIKIDSEFMLVVSASGSTVTVERAWNGTTAATHLILANVYVWRTQGEINRACRDIVMAVYNNRYGNAATGQITITAAGVIVTPDDIPATTRLTLEQIARKGW